MHARVERTDRMDATTPASGGDIQSLDELASAALGSLCDALIDQLGGGPVMVPLTIGALAGRALELAGDQHRVAVAAAINQGLACAGVRWRLTPVA